jgi:hypothetical protein
VQPEPKYIRPGEHLSFGGPDDLYEITAALPKGLGRVVALVVPDKAIITTLLEKSGISHDRYVATRGLLISPGHFSQPDTNLLNAAFDILQKAKKSLPSQSPDFAIGEARYTIVDRAN